MEKVIGEPSRVRQCSHVTVLILSVREATEFQAEKWHAQVNILISFVL